MLYTPQKTLQLVLESGNDYLVAVKQNQPHLYEHLQTFDRHLRPIAESTEELRARGRHEYRQVNVYQPSGLDQSQWVDCSVDSVCETVGDSTGQRL